MTAEHLLSSQELLLLPLKRTKMLLHSLIYCSDPLKMHMASSPPSTDSLLLEALYLAVVGLLGSSCVTYFHNHTYRWVHAQNSVQQQQQYVSEIPPPSRAAV